MADYGTRYTDRQADLLDAEIAKVYKEAQNDIQRKMNEFYKAYAERARKKKADLDAGKITLQEYQKWLRGQVFQSQRWKEKRDSIAKTLTEADRKAAQIINKRTPDVFRENANYTAYDIERGTKGGISFNLYDSKTVEKLIKDKPELLPRRVIDGRKADAWNRKEIANAVSQGIIQGESIPKLAARIARDTGIKNGNSSMLYARTAMTGAQNAGRQERLEDAQNMGIEVKKKWLATLDNRTRDTHQKLDGQEVAVDESFVVDGMKIDYPGDPTADPSLVYNCRCTLIYVYPKYQHLQHAKRYDQEAGTLIENMTYKQWAEMKKPEQKTVTRTFTTNVVQGKDISATWNRRPDKFDFEIEDVINAQGFDGKPRVVDADEFDKLVKQANGGQGFIAQRTYSAPDQETLDDYRKMLYDGKWYVDCSTGGAQYGQGMYCAADYGGQMTDGIKAEMMHYQELNTQRGNPFAYTETLTLDKSAKIIKYDDLYNEYSEYKANAGSRYAETFINGLSDYSDDFKTALKGQLNIGNVDFSESFAAYGRLSGSDEIKDMAGMLSQIRKGMTTAELQASNMNIGSFATLHGYDAINAAGHGASKSYTVILNRTKLIIRRAK